MHTALKLAKNGFSFFILYLGLLFIVPMVLLMMNVQQIDISPAVLGHLLFSIQVDGSSFTAHGTLAGSMISFGIGVVVYVLFKRMVRLAKGEV
ncbi:hypothetical protein [Jeotgalibacillus sp. JSM ZJ347]|uniref:hypothetical protein n=1 Tax=Jeotgalibacillus sp. JSM ZJ347 TaxID=3342117 RepID=UPI0035A8FA62